PFDRTPLRGEATGETPASVGLRGAPRTAAEAASQVGASGDVHAVREAGLEPARPRTPGPKPGAAASYATRARGSVYGASAAPRPGRSAPGGGDRTAARRPRGWDYFGSMPRSRRS